MSWSKQRCKGEAKERVLTAQNELNTSWQLRVHTQGSDYADVGMTRINPESGSGG